MKTAILIALGAVFATMLLIALNGCKLDPSKLPPCTGREAYPDPCASAPRDAGRE